MPLPATWTGVAIAAAAAADPSRQPAPAASADGPVTATPAAAVASTAEPAGLPFSFPLPEGVRLVMGSEIVADPRLGLQALVGEATPDPPAEPAAADDDGDDGPNDAVDREVAVSALATLTTGAAQALGAGAEWGTLQPGRLADLVVLSADLFELPAARLLDAVVIATVVDGKLVFDRDTDVPPPTP
jgi:predicted amidohydrolase YtcJ